MGPPTVGRVTNPTLRDWRRLRRSPTSASPHRQTVLHQLGLALEATIAAWLQAVRAQGEQWAEARPTPRSSIVPFLQGGLGTLLAACRRAEGDSPHACGVVVPACQPSPDGKGQTSLVTMLCSESCAAAGCSCRHVPLQAAYISMMNYMC